MTRSFRASADASRLTAAQTLADSFVAERDLWPPVDVDALVEDIADVRRINLDPGLDFDAVMHGLGAGGDDGDQPSIVLNDDRPERRIRFTLAHELGHLLIAWHVGTIGCNPDAEDLKYSEAKRPIADLFGPIELEADAFAARLLVPARFVATLASKSPDEMLTRLDNAHVSPPASLRALSSLLPTGHIFALLDSTGAYVRAVYTSPGTRSPGLRGDARLDDDQMSAVVDAQGRGHLDGRPVWWGTYRATVVVGDGGDEWQPILESILSEVTPGEGREGPMWKSINGVVSYPNSKAPDASIDELAAQLRFALRRRDNLRAVASHRRFDEFVAARARAFRAAKGHKKG